MAQTCMFSRWSVELAQGWAAETRLESLGGERTEFLAIVPETYDALLRLTPDERGLMDAAKWVEVCGQFNRAMGRPVSVARCGDFTGNLVEFATSDEWLRGWALCADSIPLDVTYCCKLEDRGRDDSVVDRMLSTLRLTS